jgi:hypothetical protein
MSRLSRLRAVAVVLAVALVGAPASMRAAPSDADRAAAQDYMRDGKELRAKGDHAGALKKFRAAFALVPSPVTGIAVAKEEIALGMLVEARETLSAIERLPVSPTETDFGREAREETARLRPGLSSRVPSVEIRVHGCRGETPTIEVDGERVQRAAAEAGVARNPGAHAVVARCPGRSPQSASLRLVERERRVVEFSFAPSDSAGDPSTRSSWSSMRTASVVIVGGGLATMVVGGILGLSARSSYSDARVAHCASGICDAEGKQLTDEAHRRGNVATVFFGIGTAVVVTGAVLWLAAPERGTTSGVTSVIVGPGTFCIRGSF